MTPQEDGPGAAAAGERGPAAPLSSDAMAARAGQVSDLLKTLAHPGRLMIVCRLVEGELSVGDLERQLAIHQPSLSQQLTVLRRAGIVQTRRQAKQVFYRLSEDRVALLIVALYEIFCARPAGPIPPES